MSGETPKTNSETPKATEWDTLADYDAIEQNLQDEFLNIEDMLKSGRINEEQAEKFRAEVTAKANAAKQPELDHEAQQYQDDEFLNIEDMLKSGRINEAQAERFRSEVEERARRATFERAHAQESSSAASEDAPENQDPTEQSNSEEAQVQPEEKQSNSEETQTPPADEKTAPEDEQPNSEAEHDKAEEENRAKSEEEERTRAEEEERVKSEEEELAQKLARAQHAAPDAENTENAQDSEAEQNQDSLTDLERAELEHQRIAARKNAIIAERLKREEAATAHIRQRIAAIKKARGIEDTLTDEDEGKGEGEGELLPEDAPLVAINADFSHDKQEIAHDLAEQELNDELSTAGFIKRIWKGNLFRKYFEKKYEREYMSGDRTITRDGEQVDVDDLVIERSNSAIKRFVLGATEEYKQLIHGEAGEKLTEADARTAADVEDAIRWFAEAEVPEDGSMTDLSREFRNRIVRLQAAARDRGEPINDDMFDNYYAVAKQARQRAEHGTAIDRVMEGFKVYNADVRNNVRGEAHRDNLDKIINAIESSKVGQVVPAEAIAAATGIAFGLTQVGARAAFGIAGALGVAGVAQGLRERNRVTEDRARMMRDLATGHEYDGTSGAAGENHAAKQRIKNEARIGGTLYDTRPASELAQRIAAASKSDNPDDLFRAIAEARVRIEYSDSEQKDLISYSSADKVGDERLALDLALVRAERGLSARDREDVAFMQGYLRHHLVEENEAKDAEFNRLRTVAAVKAAGKSIAFGALFSAATTIIPQEAIAAMDPAKLGVFEKAGLLQTANNEDASETLLASLIGPRTTHAEEVLSGATSETHTETKVIEDIEGDRTAEIERYKEKGWEQVEVKPGWTETKQDLVSVAPSASDHQLRVTYDGWANNGTTFSDSNELNASLVNGQFVSSMSGNSTMDGQSFDYGQLVSSGRVKGYLTIGGAKFEVLSALDDSGQLTWGENGTFTTATGETIKAIGDDGEKLYQYFEIALDNGTDADGVTHIVPFATDAGADTFSGTIDQVTETTIEHPATYNFVKDVEVAAEASTEEVANEVLYNGIAVPGIIARTGVGPAREPETPPSTPTEVPAVDPDGVTMPIRSNSRPTPVRPQAQASAQSQAPAQPAPEAAPSTPDTSPEPTEAPSEPTSVAEQPTTPESTPAQPEQPENAFRTQINEQFGSLIGDEGVDLMTSKERLNRDDFLRIANWWNRLPSEEARTAVIQYETSPAQPEYGGALRSWLQAQGLISAGPA